MCFKAVIPNVWVESGDPKLGRKKILLGRLFLPIANVCKKSVNFLFQVLGCYCFLLHLTAVLKNSLRGWGKRTVIPQNVLNLIPVLRQKSKHFSIEALLLIDFSST